MQYDYKYNISIAAKRNDRFCKVCIVGAGVTSLGGKEEISPWASRICKIRVGQIYVLFSLWAMIIPTNFTRHLFNKRLIMLHLLLYLYSFSSYELYKTVLKGGAIS